MKKMLMIATCALALAACGDDTDPKGGNNGNPNNGTPNNGNPNNGNPNNGNPNNGTPNNGNANNGTADATCTDACTVLVSNTCAGVPTQGECETQCGQQFTQALINCVAGTTTCADAEACIENPPVNNGNTGNGVGADCDDNDGCDSNYCKKPAGAFDGKCAINDFGESCEKGGGGADCEYGACIVRNDNDDFGFCTNVCESFTDCPTFWDCGELANAAGKYCLQD